MIEISLIGPMVIRDPQGSDIRLRNRKSQAILAVLALSRDGLRTRKWLQDLFWSDRAEPQGAGSLRTCLHEIRKALGPMRHILESDAFSARLDVSQLKIDVLEMSDPEWRAAAKNGQEFLEGFDIRDPQFETWLRAQRSIWHQKLEEAQGAPQPAMVASPMPPPPSSMTPPEHNWSLALAVLPLENRTQNPELQFWGEGLSEDLIDRLQRVRWLPVIARASSFAQLQGSDENRLEHARTLGALYALDGAIIPWRGGFAARIYLIETENEHVLWSDSISFSPDLENDLGAILDEVTSAISRSVTHTYQRRILASPPVSWDYHDQIWRGRWHMGQFTARDSDIAHQYFQTALQVQPDAPEALIQMGYWHLWRAWVTRDTTREVYELAARLARRALAVDPDDGRAYALLGTSKFWNREHEEAEALFRRAIALTPSLATGHQQLGTLLHYSDRPEEAIVPMKTAMRYSPRDQLEFGYQTELAAALLRTGQAQEAWERSSIALTHKPRYWYAHLIRILAAREIGETQLLATARNSLNSANLNITPHHIDWLPLRESAFRRELVSALN